MVTLVEDVIVYPANGGTPEHFNDVWGATWDKNGRIFTVDTRDSDTGAGSVVTFPAASVLRVESIRRRTH